ncbi:MAG: MATE family efflux transporter [Cellulosilyticaceae bacterium]
MLRLTKEKAFYSNFFSLFFVLVLQNILVLSVNLIDNIMIGAYSEVALAGVAAVNQIQFILQQMMNGIGDGAVVLASQYWGQKTLEPIRKLSAIAIRMGLVIAIVLFVIVTCFPHQVLGLFTNDKAIILEGMHYLQIIRWSYVVFAITTLLLATLRSVETVKIAFYISISTLLINCCINYILIYGRFGAPELGVRGAAIGTLTARCVELGIVLYFIVFKEKKLRLKLQMYFKLDYALLKDYWQVSLPVFIVATMWGASTALQTVILGHMNAHAIAANSVASTLFLILKVAAVGASASATIIIGKTIGAGKLDAVKSYTQTLQVIFIGIGLLTSIALFVLRVPILSLYNLSAETKELANAFLLVLCVTCIGTAYQMPVLTGIVRGGGDTRFVMINDLISIWCIVLPVSFLAAFVWEWSPVVVVCCLNSDQIFKCVAAAIKVNRYRWIKKLTNPVNDLCV